MDFKDKAEIMNRYPVIADMTGRMPEKIWEECKIEYNPKEPRSRSYPSNVYSTLLMVKEIGMDNCGVTIKII